MKTRQPFHASSEQKGDHYLIQEVAFNLLLQVRVLVIDYRVNNGFSHWVKGHK